MYICRICTSLTHTHPHTQYIEYILTRVLSFCFIA